MCVGESLLFFQIATYPNDEHERKFTPGRRCASENRGCYIDGTWPVHRLRHLKGDPFCVAIVQDKLLDIGIG